MRSRRPSYAEAVATAAIAIAVGGSAYAAARLPANSVGSRELKTNAIRASELAARSVTSTAIRDGSLGPAEFAPGSLRPGAAGPAGPAGAAGAVGEPGQTGRPSVSYHTILGPGPVVFAQYAAAVSYPLTQGATWTQLAGRTNLISGELESALVDCAIGSTGLDFFIDGAHAGYARAGASGTFASQQFALRLLDAPVQDTVHTITAMGRHTCNGGQTATIRNVRILVMQTG